MALNIKRWQPADLLKGKKAPITRDAQWEEYREEITWLHRFELPHTEILSVLRRKHGFEPT